MRPLARLTTLLAALLVALVPAAAMAIEEPPSRLLRTAGPLEIREIAAHLVAETVVEETDFDAAGNEGFRRLARYIFGGNTARSAAGGAQQIAMTAPVGQKRTGERIEMTAPVGQRSTGPGWTVAFTMPAAWTRESLPSPLDARIVIREVPARTVAVLRFSGFWSEERFAAKTAELLAAVRAAGLTPAGEPETARYDPPFKPWFMRRNEVMVQIAALGDGSD